MIDIKDSRAAKEYLAARAGGQTTAAASGTDGTNDFLITVRSLRAQNSGAEVAVTVELSNPLLNLSEKRKYVLLLEVFSELNLRRGEITREKLLGIETAANLSAALQKGAGILGYGANSGQALCQKLRRRGFSAEIAGQAVEILKRKGYLQEDSDATREAERTLAKGWGLRRIGAYLRQRGYDDAAIRGALDGLSEVDFTDRCAAVARKKMKTPPADAAEKQKLVAFLLRYGYDMTEIREALKTAWAGE